MNEYNKSINPKEKQNTVNIFNIVEAFALPGSVFS